MMQKGQKKPKEQFCFQVVPLRKSFFEEVRETHPENNVKGSQFVPK
jgi:hypothetical protein